MNHFIEFRSLNLKPGIREQFHRLYIEEALPPLQRWNFDVVPHGPSPHDENTYYVIRRYESLSQCEQMEDDYYASDDWRLGPRERILALIENYADIFLELGDGHYAEDALEELMRESDIVKEGSDCPLWGEISNLRQIMSRLGICKAIF